MVLHHLGQLLEELGRGAAAAWTGRDHRRECTLPGCLQQLLRNDHFLRTRLARFGGQGNADGVADAFLQQHCQRRRRSHDALAADPRLGQAEVQREVRAQRKVAVDRDQLLHATDLGREHDAVTRQAQLDRGFGRVQRRADQCLAQHPAGIPWLRTLAVLVHQLGRQRLVQRAPVGADAHGLVVLDRELDQLRELGVLLLAEADIARVDAVLGQRLGTGRLTTEQLVTVVVEVADQRHVDAHHAQLFNDARNGGGGFRVVDGQPHHLRAGAPELGHLLDAGSHVGGIGVGHRLHHHGAAPTHLHAADIDSLGDAAGPRGSVGGRSWSGHGVMHGGYFSAPAARPG